LLVIPTPKKENRTLTNLVNEQRGQEEVWRYHPCHRLDRDTSGVIIYAKGKSAQKQMMKVFEKGQIDKQYIAFVYGRLKKKER